MGRKYTGIWTTTEAKKIDIGMLLEKGLLKNGSRTFGELFWTNTRTGEKNGSISFVADMSGKDRHLNLIYETTYKDNNERKIHSYQIRIAALPSNLGKGEVLYFVCPNTGQKCRILYKAYNSDTWMSREAYFKPIYYDLQQCSKLDRYNTKYMKLEKQLLNIPHKRINSTYKGIRSKSSIRREKMINELCTLDELRWSEAGMPKKLYKIAKAMGY